MATGKEQFGDRYWCVGLQDGTEVHAHADEVRVEPSGTLLLIRRSRDDRREQVNLGFANGHWGFVYAASGLNGQPVAAVRWAGRTIEGSVEDWAL